MRQLEINSEFMLEYFRDAAKKEICAGNYYSALKLYRKAEGHFREFSEIDAFDAADKSLNSDATRVLAAGKDIERGIFDCLLALDAHEAAAWELLRGAAASPKTADYLLVSELFSFAGEEQRAEAFFNLSGRTSAPRFQDSTISKFPSLIKSLISQREFAFALKLLEKMPGLEADYSRAVCHLNLGNYQCVKSISERLLRLEPYTPLAFSLRGISDYMLTETQTENSEEVMRMLNFSVCEDYDALFDLYFLQRRKTDCEHISYALIETFPCSEKTYSTARRHAIALSDEKLYRLCNENLLLFYPNDFLAKYCFCDHAKVPYTPYRSISNFTRIDPERITLLLDYLEFEPDLTAVKTLCAALTERDFEDAELQKIEPVLRRFMASRALGIIKKEVLKSMLILGISEVLAVFDGTAVITESGDEFSDPAFTNTYISLLLTEPNPKARLKEIFCGLPSVKSPNAKSGAAFYLYMKMSGKVYSQEVVAEIFSTTARDIAQALEGIAI